LSASCPCRFILHGKSLGTHWIGGRMDPRAGLDNMEKLKFLTLQGLELRHFGRPDSSQSLYRLRYRGSSKLLIVMLIYHSHKSTDLVTVLPKYYGMKTCGRMENKLHAFFVSPSQSKCVKEWYDCSVCINKNRYITPTTHHYLCTNIIGRLPGPFQYSLPRSVVSPT
jgi:hypothetical protein